MKMFIVFLLIILLLVLWSRYQKLVDIVRGQLEKKKTTLPNEIIVDTQRITEVGKRNNVRQWFFDRGYTEKRVFELAGQVRLHLFSRDEEGAVIDLLTKGDDATMAKYQARVELEGGLYSDVEFNQYLLFPEQRILFPNYVDWMKKCKNTRQERPKGGRKKGEKNYRDNNNKKTEQSAKPINNNEQLQQNSSSAENATGKKNCRRIIKTKFSPKPIGATMDFNQGGGPQIVKVGLIDSKADYTAYLEFEEPLRDLDPYVQYLENGSNDFDGLNLSLTEAHGTFMASIIAVEYSAEAQLKIKNYPFHDGERGYLIEVVAAVYSAVHEGVDILNLSLGYASGARNEHVQRALEYAASQDVLVICAAGNVNTDNDSNPFWPANFSSMKNVIAVGATNDVGDRWVVGVGQGSNYGAITVSLAAKGVDVLGFVNATDQMQLSGTSCAAAFISSMAANLKSATPLITAHALKETLLDEINKGNGIFISEESTIA